ncbi:MAG: hypothetical protein JWO41_25 [Candidatus Saccharibacteria bacterium]|nr:hypothetical protein [Candidatus Saccharibacteria bacterium]
MASSKKYFHDHLVLLLLSVQVFLAFAGSIFVLLRLVGGHSSGHIVAYRPALGVNAYQPGSVQNLLGFVGFALLVLLAHTVLSMRTYRIHRQLSVAILSLGILLLVLNIIVSNALLLLG